MHKALLSFPFGTWLRTKPKLIIYKGPRGSVIVFSFLSLNQLGHPVWSLIPHPKHLEMGSCVDKVGSPMTPVVISIHSDAFMAEGIL